MVFTDSLLGARHLRDVVKSKPASSLVVSLSKALNGKPPTIMWQTGGQDTSEMATPKQLQASRAKNSDTIRFLVNGG